jgi:hypothetical protein
VLPRVPQPRTSPPYRSELRCCQVPLVPGPRLLTEVNSSAVTCPMASGSAFLRGELLCCHLSHSPGLCLSERGAPVLPHPTPPSGLWTTGIKKDLAPLGTQLGSRVSKARSCVTEALARRVGRYSVSLQCSIGPADYTWTWLQ